MVDHYLMPFFEFEYSLTHYFDHAAFHAPIESQHSKYCHQANIIIDKINS